MILRSIRLHPFAGINDKTYQFNKEFTVICGPNEEGKSTVARALKFVLFTETKLTPARKTAVLKDVLPVAGGDTIRVSLHFIVGDVEYQLTKQWGGADATELKSADVTITNPSAVQEKLHEMLPANQAVVEQVLIASQSQLANAVDNLSEDVQTSLSDQLRASVLKGGGVSATRLEDKINEKVEQYFGRWDEASGTIQGGASRGLLNPWKNGVGVIADAWYKLEEAKSLQDEIINFDTENNRLQTNLNSVNEELKVLGSFLSENKAANAAVTQRITLEAQLEKYNDALKQFAADAQRWPVVIAERNAALDASAKVDTELAEVRNELDIARQKELAKTDQERLNRVKELEQLLQSAESTLKNSVDVPASAVEEARRFQQEINRCHNLIDGQKLTMRIESTVSGDLQVIHSGGQQDTIDFDAGKPVQRAISGSVQFEWQGATFTVASANADIQQLEQKLQKAEADLKVLLNQYNQSTPEDLSRAADAHRQMVNTVTNAKANLKAALGNEKAEDLKLRCRQAAALPGTRDPKVLEQLLSDKTRQSGQFQSTVQVLDKELNVFVTKHQSPENLDERRLNGREQVKEREAALAQLAPLPAGYESATDFQGAYHEAEVRERLLSNQKHEIEIQQKALKEPSVSIIDAKEQTLSAKTRFEQALLEGRAYRRIQAKLNELLASADAGAFMPLHEKTESYLNVLSGGRFKHIPFDVTKPQLLEGDNVSLPVGLLSKGTKDILALSLRLAAAEVYLHGKGGFVMMDDPLVDMDAKRRDAAATVLQRFSQQHQTIVFTCHEAHAGLFAEAGA